MGRDEEDLVAQSLTKVFGAGDTAVEAVRDASLSVRAGEFVAIVGPSGSGKTTLLAMLGGLLTATGGRVIVGGTDISRLNEAQRARFRRERVGFVFQGFNLVPYLTAEQNLLVIPSISGKLDGQMRARAGQLLQELGVKKRARHLPGELSGGERQRVAIGRALMNDPLLVLVDEPTSNLDSERGTEVVRSLAEEVKLRNKIGIMVTHDRRMLTHVDRILEIADGRLHSPESSP
ncbi:MAG: ABC transporter ATP-binding protein [Dehalococcoidia bacterium]|nr:MAG: ABC transporter ATP-binding protein [Dehalococcoidia bacterium]